MSESMTTASYPPSKPTYPHGPAKKPVKIIDVKDDTAKEGENVEFVVKFDGPVQEGFHLYYKTNEITADDPQDYAGTGGVYKSMYIAEGTKQAVISIKTKDNDYYKEANKEYFGLHIKEYSKHVEIKYGEDKAVGTIKDTYEKPQKYKMWVDENEHAKEGEYLDFKVKLDKVAKEDVHFKWTTHNITTENGDFSPTASHGKVEAGKDYAIVRIKAETDKDYKEGTEKFKFSIDPKDDEHVKIKDGDDHAYGEIKDAYKPEPPKYEEPKVSVSDAHAKEGKDQYISFHVKVEGENKHGLDIYYATEKGTANANPYHLDYVASGGKYGKPFHLDAGKTEGDIMVKLVNDKEGESTEHFSLKIIDANGYKLGYHPTATGTIYDDDVPVATIAASDLSPMG